MESLLIWGLALIAATIVLTVIELFVPSGGLIALVAGICGVGGTICLFIHDWRWGVAAAAVLIILVPLVFAFWTQVVAYTPMGRRLIHGETGEPETVLHLSEPSPLEALIGSEAEVLTDLRPVGQIRLGGQRYDARSEVSYIRPGNKVRVVKVENNQLVVRPVAS